MRFGYSTPDEDRMFLPFFPDRPNQLGSGTQFFEFQSEEVALTSSWQCPGTTPEVRAWESLPCGDSRK